MDTIVRRWLLVAILLTSVAYGHQPVSFTDFRFRLDKWFASCDPQLLFNFGFKLSLFDKVDFKCQKENHIIDGDTVCHMKCKNDEEDFLHNNGNGFRFDFKELEWRCGKFHEKKGWWVNDAFALEDLGKYNMDTGMKNTIKFKYWDGISCRKPPWWLLPQPENCHLSQKSEKSFSKICIQCEPGFELRDGHCFDPKELFSECPTAAPPLVCDCYDHVTPGTNVTYPEPDHWPTWDDCECLHDTEFSFQITDKDFLPECSRRVTWDEAEQYRGIIQHAIGDMGVALIDEAHILGTGYRNGFIHPWSGWAEAMAPVHVITSICHGMIFNEGEHTFPNGAVGNNGTWIDYGDGFDLYGNFTGFNETSSNNTIPDDGGFIFFNGTDSVFVNSTNAQEGGDGAFFHHGHWHNDTHVGIHDFHNQHHDGHSEFHPHHPNHPSRPNNNNDKDANWYGCECSGHFKTFFFGIFPLDRELSSCERLLYIAEIRDNILDILPYIDDTPLLIDNEKYVINHDSEIDIVEREDLPKSQEKVDQQAVTSICFVYH